MSFRRGLLPFSASACLAAASRRERPFAFKPCVYRKIYTGLSNDKLTKTRVTRGVFRSLRELKDAIHRFLDHTNANPKPFTWTKDPNKIIAAVRREHQVLDSI